MANGLRDYLDGLKRGLAQGGVVGGLYSAAGVDPSSGWYPGLMHATQDVGRTFQGLAAGDPEFTTHAAQDDQALAQQYQLGMGNLGLRSQEYDLQARQAQQEQDMTAELSQLQPTDRSGIANVYMRYGHADKALELLKQSKSERPYSLQQGTQNVVIDPATGQPMPGFGGPRSTGININMPPDQFKLPDLMKAVGTVSTGYRSGMKKLIEGRDLLDHAGDLVDRAVSANAPNSVEAYTAIRAFLKSVDNGMVREYEMRGLRDSQGLVTNLEDRFREAKGGLESTQLLKTLQKAIHNSQEDVPKLIEQAEKPYKAQAAALSEAAKRSGYDVGDVWDMVHQPGQGAQQAPPGFTPTGKTADGKTIYRTPDGKTVVWQD